MVEVGIKGFLKERTFKYGKNKWKMKNWMNEC